MTRLVLFISLFLSFALPASAQSDEEVAAARLVFLDGDYATALAVLRPAAEAGNAVAQNLMGAAYEGGDGVEVDIATSVAWYEKAAAQDMDKALYNLGVIYAEGREGISRDYDTAAAYYDRAIAVGYHFAMNNRGLMHEYGRGGPVDLDAAIALYEQAVELGNTLAMNNLGKLLAREEEGFEGRDLDRSLALFQRSAALGDLTGLNNLGAMYANGYVVAEDDLAAMGLYTLAARAGETQAAINLAYMLIDGPEAYRDPVEGYAWCLYGADKTKPDNKPAYEADCRYLRGLIDQESADAAVERVADW